MLYFLLICHYIDKIPGVMLFSSKRVEKESDIAVFSSLLFCRIGYFPTKQYEIPLVLLSSSCAPFSGLLSLGRECAHYTTVLDLLILLNLTVCLSVCPSVCPSDCLSICLSVCPSVRPSVCLSIICLSSFCLSVCIRLYICLSVSVCVCVIYTFLLNFLVKQINVYFIQLTKMA